MKCAIANQTAIQFTADPTGDIDYSLVLDIGAQMREALALRERAVANSSAHRRPYHRCLMLLPQLNRVLRLHRPFFMRGWTEPEYATSTEDAMAAASAICLGLEELRVDDGNVEHVSLPSLLSPLSRLSIFSSSRSIPLKYLSEVEPSTLTPPPARLASSTGLVLLRLWTLGHLRHLWSAFVWSRLAMHAAANSPSSH